MTITNKVSLKSVMAGNTPIADVVDAPTIGVATAGLESATVAYTAAATGGTATSFTAISTPGSITGTGASPITVSGLTGDTSYTFKVYGTNASGAWSGVQSAASNSVTPTTTAFESIATATGNGTASSVTFSSIPNTYKSLQIRISYLATATKLFLQPNGDTSTANYARHSLYADGATVSVLSVAASTSPFITNLAVDSSTTNPTVVIIDIHDYASTSKYKTVRVFTGIDNNGSGAVNLNSILWMSTTAISSLVIPNQNGTNYNTGSVFSLYGVK